jgi:hypothetical protein
MQLMPLNVFQRIMCLWDEVHPYNAAQVLHIEGTPDMGKLSDAWNRGLAAMGLGQVVIDGNGFHHEILNGHAHEHPVRLVEPNVSLEDFISQEMNSRFGAAEASSPNSPFRPFILLDGDSFYAGVVYHHWVADSASIRMLLREWFVRAYDPARARCSPLRMPRGGYWHYFGPGRGRWGLADGMLSTLRSTTRLCNSRQITDKGGDFHVRYSLHPLPDGMIDDLRKMARGYHATLNDVFLAAMARACDRHGATPRTESKRDLALGTIIDIRPGSRHDLSDTFGLFLGFTTVVVRPDAFSDSVAMLHKISAQTASQKRNRAAESSVLRMAGGLTQAMLLKPQQRTEFYRKYMPMAAGISNVNLNQSWPAAYHPSPLLNYLRVTPTGPMLPLVFTTTTIGKRFHVALTRRSALVDDDAAAHLVSTFMGELTAMTANPGRC